MKVALLAFAMLAAGHARALEIQQTLWGFDGRVMPGCFSPLSLLMENPGNSPFEGDMTCSEVDGLGGRRGAEYFQPVYLAPHTARWVQFQVFVSGPGGDFTVGWGRSAAERQRLKNPIVVGPPACVWIYEDSNPLSRHSGLKSFPDALFPTSVSATDSLDAAVLDYVPRWEPARREAFLDWVKRGGIVHLLPGADGQYPVFPESLAALNVDGDRMRVGSGLVARHPAIGREIGAAYLAAHGFPEQILKQEQSPPVYSLETTLFQNLSRLTRPEIAWGLLAALTFLYVGLVGPAHYLIRGKMDYRVSILALLGMVAVFGGTFAFVGRRGYNESQMAHSLAIARALGGRRWDVTQWISAFATRGDLYSLTHAAPANLYAAPSSESVRGRILNGKDGRFFADIPLYSSIAFTHRAMMPGDDTSVTIQRWETDDNGLSALELKPGAGFPKEVIEIRVRGGDGFRELVRKGEILELKGKAAEPVKDFLSSEKLRRSSVAGSVTKGDDMGALTTALPLLYADAAGLVGAGSQILTERPRGADQLQLFVAARSPAGFRLLGKGFDRETGCVLYVQDIFKP